MMSTMYPESLVYFQFTPYTQGVRKTAKTKKILSDFNISHLAYLAYVKML